MDDDMVSTSETADMPTSRGDARLGDILYKMAVNFLLYVVLIIVFYMLIRFYLEEDTSTRGNEYFTADTEESDDEKEEKEGENKNQNKNKKKNTIKGKELDGVLAADETGAAGKDSPTSRSPTKKSVFDFKEWKQEDVTKEEVIQRLVICSLGLIISFTLWGLVQERMLTQPYDGDFFEYSYGLVFMTRLGGLIMSIVLMHVYNVKWTHSVLWEYSFPAVANMMSSWSQYEALKYVSFPAVMLAKAFKMVPVMLMGAMMLNKKYETYEYVSGFVVGFGLYLFLSTSENVVFQQNVFGDPETISGSLCGVALLIFFLFYDSATSQWQSRLFEINANLSPIQMMLIMNAFSGLFSFVTLVNQEEYDKTFLFLYDHPLMFLHVCLFIIFGTVGQLFIFYTVKNFGAVVFSIIMSLRILFSALLSCYVYSHSISELGVLGIIIVFSAISYRINRKMSGQQLIRWKDPSSEDTKGLILKEWHEHIDG